MRRRSFLASSVALVGGLATACGVSSQTLPATNGPPSPKSAPSSTSPTSAIPTAAAAARQIKAVIRAGALTLDPTQITSGQVSFMISNADSAGHAFIVVMTELSPNALPLNAAKTMADLAVANVHEVGHSTGAVPPGGSVMLALTLDTGRYVSLCNLPGHYQAGEFAGFSATV